MNFEKVFGKVRTMVGNDTNADVLQLANRIDGAVQCVNIPENHPDWGGDARRLKIKPLNSYEAKITSKYDHLNPAAFTGDLRVSSVILLGSWNEGRRLAEQGLRSFGVEPPFERMETEGGFDMLCPFGKGKMVLVGGLELGEQDETEEEQDHSAIAESTVPDLTTDDFLQPDLDDLAGNALSVSSLPEIPSNLKAPPTAYVSINSGDSTSKPIHKSSILRLYSSPLTLHESRDRLKRVRGYSRYNEVKTDSIEATDPGNDDADTLDVQDPAFVLVQCDKHIFLAVIQVLGIRRDGKDIQSISSHLLIEPSTRVNGQIMKLSPILVDDSTSHQFGSADWEWNGSLEPGGVLRDLYGRFISQADPQLQRASRGQNMGEDTYVFKTNELRGIAAVMFERLSMDTLPRVSITESFPYRTSNGKFHCCIQCRLTEYSNRRVMLCV